MLAATTILELLMLVKLAGATAMATSMVVFLDTSIITLNFWFLHN